VIASKYLCYQSIPEIQAYEMTAVIVPVVPIRGHLLTYWRQKIHPTADVPLTVDRHLLADAGVTNGSVQI
jgi:hypothetical protein